MIAADHIAIDGDRAWWVLGPWTQDDNPPIKQLDRKCDTCGGTGLVDAMSHTGDAGCPRDKGCDGTRRHTFEVNVACIQRADLCDHKTCGTLRVSVVPGMVLELDGEFLWFDDCQHDGGQWLHQPDGRDGDATVITLPPAARPGMWAVMLAVHQ